MIKLIIQKKYWYIEHKEKVNLKTVLSLGFLFHCLRLNSTQVILTLTFGRCSLQAVLTGITSIIPSGPSRFLLQISIIIANLTVCYWLRLITRGSNELTHNLKIGNKINLWHTSIKYIWKNLYYLKRARKNNVYFLWLN